MSLDTERHNNNRKVIKVIKYKVIKSYLLSCGILAALGSLHPRHQKEFGVSTYMFLNAPASACSWPAVGCRRDTAALR